jgi:CO/xanthine dehydrogenase FAD-binding subunit
VACSGGRGVAGEAAVADARPLAKNAYKVPLTQKLVERTILELAGVTA